MRIIKRGKKEALFKFLRFILDYLKIDSSYDKLS